MSHVEVIARLFVLQPMPKLGLQQWSPTCHGFRAMIICRIALEARLLTDTAAQAMQRVLSNLSSAVTVLARHRSARRVQLRKQYVRVDPPEAGMRCTR